MLDPKFVRENSEMVKSSEIRRGRDGKNVDQFLEWDGLWRTATQDAQDLKSSRNRITELIAEMKKKGENASEKINHMKNLSEEIKNLDSKLATYREKRDDFLYRIGNVLSDDVPEGKDENDNVEIRKWGEIRKFDFDLRNHSDIIESSGSGDFDKAAEVSGKGFNYLIGDMVLLDRALQSYALEFMMNRGFTPVQPPFIMKTDVMKWATDLGAFEESIYSIEDGTMSLIATSEHPIAALFKDEVIDVGKLPILVTGISSCYRKEIGAHGIDTKGLYRMHQFNKVEQFVICKPEESWEWFEKMQTITEELMQSLGIPYRVLNLCGGDIGVKAAKQYDVEAWFPRQNGYGEVTSCSNCTDYQSIGLNVKYGKYGGDKEYVHMLNNTALATSRIMVAIIENFQNQDGSVDVPEILQKYIGKKVLFK